MSPTIITSLFGSILRVGRTFTPPMGTPNGIAELQSVDLNGYPQWLLIRGQDASRPVLLFLHGGPGESNMWLAHYTMKELEKYFVCVNWDQRGTGKSFRPGPPPESMTIDQFVQDTIALIELLLARFGQKKILLLGHSWGSVLAMKVAAARPDLLYAVIGMGQVVDNQRGEDLSYRYVLERAHAEHNRKAIRSLEQLGGGDTYRKDSTFVQRKWLVHYGGMMHTPDTGAIVSILLNAPECSIADCIRGLRRRDLKFSCRLMGDEIMGVHLLQEIPELSVPVFFFAGSYDYTTPCVLVEQFYARLSAPYKKLIWFEHSAHMPHMEEPDKFQRELIAIGNEFCCEKRPQDALFAKLKRKKENDPTSQKRFSERRANMKFLSHLTSRFKASVPPAQEEIGQHVHRLNMLLLASQQVKTMTVAEWRATEREIEMELQWFDIHHLKLTSTAYPILPTTVQSADAIGLKSPLTLTHSPSR